EALIDEIKYLSTFLPAKAIEKCVLVPLKKVEKFEKDKGVTLPWDYKRIVTEIGGESFMMSFDDSVYGQSKKDFRPVYYFLFPSSFSGTFLPPPPELYNHLEHLYGDDSDARDDEQIHTWEYEDEFLARMENGFISVGYAGCMCHDILVISGPERGHLWYRDHESCICEPLEGIMGDKSRCTIAEHAIKYLQRSLSHYYWEFCPYCGYPNPIFREECEACKKPSGFEKLRWEDYKKPWSDHIISDITHVGMHKKEKVTVIYRPYLKDVLASSESSVSRRKKRIIRLLTLMEKPGMHNHYRIRHVRFLVKNAFRHVCKPRRIEDLPRDELIEKVAIELADLSDSPFQRIKQVEVDSAREFFTNINMTFNDATLAWDAIEEAARDLSFKVIIHRDP
nr:hypothetical protein [Candidatus Sigynarchaeota archaeon]